MPIISGGGVPFSSLPQAIYLGGVDHAVQDQTPTLLPWETPSTGNGSVVNLATPTRPVVLTTGRFACTANVIYSDAAQAGKLATCYAHAWRSGTSGDPHGYAQATINLALGNVNLYPIVCLAWTWEQDAGAAIEVHVYHEAGVPLNFQLIASIQKLA